MPYAPAETRAASWSETDYTTRFAEVRSELADSLGTDDDTHRAAYASLAAEVDQLDVEYRIVLMQHEREQRTRAFGTGQVNAAMLSMGQEEYRSVGQLVVENEEFREWANLNVGRERISNSPLVELRTLITEASGSATGANYLLPVGQPYLGNVRRMRLFLRDIMAGGSTTLSAIPYVRELNAASNATSASTVAENATKPEAVIAFSSALAPTTVIATSVPVTNQVIADAPTVMSYINGRLVYMLKLREELEMLNGNGIFPDLQGLLTVSGNQSQAATSGETAITIGKAIAKIVAVDGYPNGVALNPTDSWNMKIKRASAGSGTFDAGTPFSSVPDMVWGLPVVETNNITAGTGLVGDYQNGCQYFDRQQAGVQIFEQHSDWALKNTSLLRAEERLAMAIYRPDFFVVTTIS